MDTALERHYRVGDERPVIVKIGFPEKSHDRPDEWSCSCQIVGLGDGKIRKSFGVDGIQALMLALKLVSNSLYSSQEYKQGHLVWWDGMDDLGLPVTEPIAVMLREMGKVVTF